MPPARPAPPVPQASQVPPPLTNLELTLDRAKLTSTGTGARALLKPNPYVEVIVDGKPPKRTDIAKSTNNPKWEDRMSIPVTPYSKLLFRMYDHSTFKKDSLLGEHNLDLYTVLKKNQGRCNGTMLTLPLKSNKPSVGSESQSIGDLVVMLDGLSVDLNSVPSASPPVGVSVVPGASALEAVGGAASSSNGTADGTRPKSYPSGTPTSSAASRSGRKNTPKLPQVPKENGVTSRPRSSVSGGE